VEPTTDGGAGVGEGDDRRCEQEARAGDEVLGDVEVANHQVGRRMVEHATELAGHERAEELGHPPSLFDRVLLVLRAGHQPNSTGHVVSVCPEIWPYGSRTSRVARVYHPMIGRVTPW